MTLSEFVSQRRRHWLKYLNFRLIPTTVTYLLTVGLVAELVDDSNTVRWLIIPTTVLGSATLGAWLRKRGGTQRFTAERLVALAIGAAGALLGAGVVTLSFHFDPRLIAPSLTGLRDNLWSGLIIAVLVVWFVQASSMGNLPAPEALEKLRLTEMILLQATRIEFRHGVCIENASSRTGVPSPLMTSILVYEDLNRPPAIRRLENLFVRLPGRIATVGVAQVKSDRPLSDAQSIQLMAEILQSSIAKHMSPGDFWFERLNSILAEYNGGSSYAENVAEILRQIDSDLYWGVFGARESEDYVPPWSMQGLSGFRKSLHPAARIAQFFRIRR